MGSMRALTAGVVGAGVFGGFHARKYAELGGVRLARVFDLDRSRAEAMAEAHNAHGFADLDAFLDGLDLVTIATPGDTHAAIGLRAIAAGAHVYVEKPVARSEADAESLLKAARAAGRVLAVGHQERVTFAAMGVLGAQEPLTHLDSVRLGAPNARNRDVSCVLDLMIHDLDLALMLARSPAVDVSARGDFDAVEAEVRFANGLTARCEASRRAPTRRREMRLDYASGTVVVDFLAPRFDNRSAVRLDAGFADRPSARDPLGESVAAFVRAACGVGKPVADGADGARALALALTVERSAGL